MKKLIAILLVLSMTFALASCGFLPLLDIITSDDTENDVYEYVPETNNQSYSYSQPKEGKYPIKWDGASLYPDYDAWLADFESISDFPDRFEQYRGKLNTVEGLLGFVDTLFDEDYHAVYDKLLIFAYYGNTAFPSDPLYLKCLAKLDYYDQQYDNATAFFDEELGAMTFEERTALIKDEKLSKYAWQLSDYLDPDALFYSEKEVLIMNTLDISRDRMENLYLLFAYAQMPPVDFKLPNGKTITLDETTLYTYINDPSIDSRTQSQMYDAWWKHTSEYADTFAYILETAMREQYADAIIAGYDNSEEASLASEDIPLDVMDRILEAAHRGAPRFAEYLGLFTGTDDTEYNSYSPYEDSGEFAYRYIPYDDAVDLVTESLGILGDDYVENFTAVLSSGFVDVYPDDGKSNGAFEWGGFYGLPPFLFFNYTGSFDDVSTIAHEGGHACYDLYTIQNQEYYNWGPGIFTQEIASTTNELLFYNYMIDNAETDSEKMYYLGNLLSMWTGTFFTQCFFQEFENYCHETVESGEALNAEEMAAKWKELSGEYYGENYSLGKYGNYRWTTLDHLYYNHYVYKYATSVCYASAIAQAIISGEDGIVEDYKEFLKSGGSCSPADALELVGIDITSDDAYNDALDYFYGILDEYEALARKS